MIINYCLSLEMKDDCQLPGTGVSLLDKGVVKDPPLPPLNADLIPPCSHPGVALQHQLLNPSLGKTG